jgi:hypothetical protein
VLIKLARKKQPPNIHWTLERVIKPTAKVVVAEKEVS